MEIFIGIQLDYKNVLNTIIKEYLMGFKELLECYSGFWNESRDLGILSFQDFMFLEDPWGVFWEI